MAKRKAKAEPVRREPSAREVEAIAAAREARNGRPVRVEYREAPGADGAMHVQACHTDDDGNAAFVTETFATRSNDFVGRSLLHLANGTATGTKPSVQGLNASIAIVAAIAPENELEAALAANMAATHDLSMALLAKAQFASRVDHMREYGNLATKLQRTFTTQMKTLSDWRRGGEQVVRHITVHEGGQAVVAGTINQGGQKPHEISAFKPHEQGTGGPAMLGFDPQGNGVPVPGDGEREVSPTRRPKSRRRGTERK